MKTVDFSQNRIGFAKSAENLRYLWKLDDPEWLKQRKDQGQYLVKHAFSDNTAKANKEYMQYFIHGEYTAYIDEISRLLFTPYISAATARQVFESGLFTPSSREMIFQRYVSVAPMLGRGMPWLGDHIKYFAEGVLGNHYEVIEEMFKGQSRTITPNPSRWCQAYMSGLKKRLNDPTEFQGLEHCIPYFVSILPHVSNPKLRERCKMEEFLSLVDNILGNENEEAGTIEIAKIIKLYEVEIRNNWTINSNLDQI